MAMATPKYEIRVMTIEDHSAVKDIAAATWKGHVHDYDYVIDAFPQWLNTKEVTKLGYMFRNDCNKIRFSPGHIIYLRDIKFI